MRIPNLGFQDRSEGSFARLEFLARLACGADPCVVASLWRNLDHADDDLGLRRLAARLGLQGVLGRFVSALPTEECGTSARGIVIDSMRSTARAEGAVQAVRKLMSSPEATEIEAIAIKGAALRLAGLYNEGERDAADGDLVVSPEMLPAVRRAAIETGLTWQLLPEGGYEAGLIVGDSAYVEVHTALAGDAGREVGLAWDALRAVARLASLEGLFGRLRLLLGHPAQELAVQHFVRHHDGDPVYALRTLQDISRLDAIDGEGSGLSLPWNDPSGLSGTLSKLREVARDLRSAAGELTPGSKRFLDRLGAMIATGRNSNGDYATAVDRWLRYQRSPSARLKLVAQSAASNEVGKGVSLDRVVRPFRMVSRYASGKLFLLRRTNPERRAVAAWRSELGSD